MSERKKVKKKLRKESYSVTPTSTEVKTVLEEIFSEILIPKLTDRLPIAYTGKLGYMKLHLALTEEARYQLGKPPLTEQESTDLMEKWDKELPEGCYKI